MMMAAHKQQTQGSQWKQCVKRKVCGILEFRMEFQNVTLLYVSEYLSFNFILLQEDVMFSLIANTASIRI
jgi:hypothetical protein